MQELVGMVRLSAEIHRNSCAWKKSAGEFNVASKMRLMPQRCRRGRSGLLHRRAQECTAPDFIACPLHNAMMNIFCDVAFAKTNLAPRSVSCSILAASCRALEDPAILTICRISLKVHLPLYSFVVLRMATGGTTRHLGHEQSG